VDAESIESCKGPQAQGVPKQILLESGKDFYAKRNFSTKVSFAHN